MKFFLLLFFIINLNIVKVHSLEYLNLNQQDITKSGNYAGLLMDMTSGKILYKHNHHAIRYPASLTKVMTLYLTFDALQRKKINLNSKIKISRAASIQPPSKTYLKAGATVTVKQAIEALIVKSANDIAYALAEKIGGNIKNFTQMMNHKAKQLNMRNSHFCNPHGLFDKNQVTTASDMLKLTLAIQQKHSRYFHFFSKKHFLLHNKKIIGHNHVLHQYNSANGLKTGFIRQSGYNLITTTSKKEGKLIAVVMGGQTSKIRDNHMISLLNFGYDKIRKLKRKEIKTNLIKDKNKPNQQQDVFAIVENQIYDKIWSNY